MTVSLIVLNYNDYKTTVEYLNIVKKYKKIDDIVVVDNCSTDNSYNELKKYETDKIVVLKSERNGGYASGNNIGIRYAKENFNPDFIMISNADVFYEENVIDKMIIELNKDEKNGMIAPMVTSNNRYNRIKGWKLPTYWDNICNISIVLSKIFSNRIYYNLEYFKNEVTYVDVIPGSLFMIKSKVMYEVGLYDEGTFLYGEENILAYKLKEKNYKCMILSGCQFLHNHSTSIVREFSSETKRFELLYSSLSYYNNKYLQVGLLKRILYKMIYKVLILEKLLVVHFRR